MVLAAGSPPPEQVTQQAIYDFIEGELTDIRSTLPGVGQAEYGRADQGTVPGQSPAVDVVICRRVLVFPDHQILVVPSVVGNGRHEPHVRIRRRASRNREEAVAGESRHYEGHEE